MKFLHAESHFRRLHIRLQGIYAAVGGKHWLPQVPLAAMLCLAAYWMLQASFGGNLQDDLRSAFQGDFKLSLRNLPSLFISGGMITMGLALLWRSRLAWIVALLLTIAATLDALLNEQVHSQFLVPYLALLVISLSIAWRRFDRSSLTASTLFALTSVFMLLIYATFGAFYFGSEFKPQITDLTTALYYAVVTMSTVGYGDIDPQTSEARLFTVSVIVVGVAVFATSLTALAAPLVTGSFQRIMQRKGKTMRREDHFVVVGNTPLAKNTVLELAKRGLAVTRILKEPPEPGESKEDDIVVGDPSMIEVLQEARVDRAVAALAMLADDSENAFVVLAVKEFAPKVRSVAAVNDTRHLNRVKLSSPDVVIAPQVLGGELTAMLLAGEQITPDFLMNRIFEHSETDKSGSGNQSSGGDSK